MFSRRRNGSRPASHRRRHFPVIDMLNWGSDPKVGDLISEAAEKWGFFQIVNHGVPLEVLEEVKVATYQFFRQPAEEKNKHSKDNSPSNNVRNGIRFTPQAEKALECKIYTVTVSVAFSLLYLSLSLLKTRSNRVQGGSVVVVAVAE
nr:feruloyl CoA ortho-hydroxylase 1-like [Ipomoea batatas]